MLAPHQHRFLILADGQFGPLTSKTANSCIRYFPERIVAVFDRVTAGRTVQDVLGFGGGVSVTGGFLRGGAPRAGAALLRRPPPGGPPPPPRRGGGQDGVGGGGGGSE